MQAARQLEGLKLGKRVIARFDVGEAFARFDREFDAANVAKPTVLQAGPAHINEISPLSE